jgi:hypothetical protein
MSVVCSKAEEIEQRIAGLFDEVREEMARLQQAEDRAVDMLLEIIQLKETLKQRGACCECMEMVNA